MIRIKETILAMAFVFASLVIESSINFMVMATIQKNNMKNLKEQQELNLIELIIR